MCDKQKKSDKAISKNPLIWLLRGLIYAYRFLLSPFLVNSCRFYPTCSEYALTALQQRGLFMGVWLTIKRLARCHPWGGSGFDPVPKKNSNEACHDKHSVA